MFVIVIYKAKLSKDVKSGYDIATLELKPCGEYA